MTDPIVQLCAFRVGDEEYAIDLMRIRSIAHPPAITPVPRARRFVDGVASLHGEVVPVIDVRRRLGLPPRKDDRRRGPRRREKLLVVNVGGKVLGLVVDEVREVMRVPRGEIRPAPELVQDEGGPQLFLGVVGGQKPGSKLRLLMNVKALLDPRAEVPPRPADEGDAPPETP